MTRSRFFTILTLLLILSACSPAVAQPPATKTVQFESEIVSMELSGTSGGQVEVIVSEIVWETLPGGTPCYPTSPAAVLKLCLKNEGEETTSPEMAAVSMPAVLDKSAFEQVLGSIPGGEWTPPYPVTLSGVPGFGGSAEGIIIVDSAPAPDPFTVGIIIIQNIPSDSNINSVLIVLQNIPDPLSAEGIIIVQNKEGGVATVGAITIGFEITGLFETSQPLSDSGFNPDFSQLASDITQDHYQVSGKIVVTDIFPHLKNFHLKPNGLIFGGLVANSDEEWIQSSHLIDPVQLSVPPGITPTDNVGETAIVWGGMPAEAVGIIIVDSVPTPNSHAEGIVIIKSENITHIMGPIVIDKPGEDGAKGIVLQNQPPPVNGKAGITWSGLAWSGPPGSEESSQAIVLQNKPTGALATLFGIPDIFDLPGGMMPMLGKSGFGPGPMAFGTLAIQAQGPPFTMAPEEEKCFEISLITMIPNQSGFGGGYFQIDSFFDVFTDLTVGMPGEGENEFLVSRINPPGGSICTPTPGPISTVIPELAAPTPTREGALPPPPTPTTRTGLPTKTPVGRPAPTPTPGRAN